MFREGTEGTLPVPVCFCLCFCWDGEYKMRRAVLFGLFLVFQLGRSVETIVINLGAENINLAESIPHDELCDRKGADVCAMENGSLSFNISTLTCHIAPSIIRPLYCRNAMMNLLSHITALFEFYHIPYWITQGTLLGAMREQALIPWTNDVDISVLNHDFPRIKEALDQFSKGKGGDLSAQDYLDGKWDGIYYNVHRNTPADSSGIPTKWISVSNGVYGVHLDMNFRTARHDAKGDAYFHEGCNVELHADCAGSFAGHIRLDDVFPLRSIKLHNKMFWSPSKPGKVLEVYYGATWETPDRYGDGDWVNDGDIHTNKGLKDEASASAPGVPKQQFSNHPRVYVNMVGDLFHHGHLKFLKMATRFGRTLIVGVYNDTTAQEAFHESPILTMHERIQIIKACRYVDEVIPNAPTTVSAEFMETNGIDLVVYGDDEQPELVQERYAGAIARNRLKDVRVPRDTMTSAKIVERVLDRSCK